jgi:hypothetical protein
VLKGFALLFEALVAGPARRRPLRALLPVAGVAVGVAAIASIHHANRSITESFRDAAGTLAGRSDFVVTGARGVPVAALAAFSFLWEHGAFAPAVTGPAVAADGSGEILQILGVDPGGDAAVREMRLLPLPARGDSGGLPPLTSAPAATEGRVSRSERPAGRGEGRTHGRPGV